MGTLCGSNGTSTSREAPLKSLSRWRGSEEGDGEYVRGRRWRTKILIDLDRCSRAGRCPVSDCSGVMVVFKYLLSQS